MLQSGSCTICRRSLSSSNELIRHIASVTFGLQPLCDIVKKSNKENVQRNWKKQVNHEYSGLTSFRSPCSPRDSQESSPTPQFESINSSALSFLYNSHIHTWLLEKTIALTRWTFVGKVTSLLFNMLSRLVIAFPPRSKRPLISWLQSPSAVISEPKKIIHK